MRIEIWLDPVCVFSYIAKHRFENALDKLNLKDSVWLEWHSFVHPYCQSEHAYASIVDFYKKEFHLSRKRARMLRDDFSEIIASEGLCIEMDKVVPCNSYNSHRLLRMAHRYQRQTELIDALFHAYFAEGKNLSQVPVLAEIGQSVGIPEDKILEMYEGYEYMVEVRRDIEYARRLEFHNVPGFYVDSRVTMFGNHPENSVADFIDSLYRQYSRRNPQPTNSLLKV